jgi:hypothetical protein
VHIDRLAVWHVDTQCAQGIFAAGSWRQVNDAAASDQWIRRALILRPFRSSTTSLARRRYCGFFFSLGITSLSTIERGMVPGGIDRD